MLDAIGAILQGISKGYVAKTELEREQRDEEMRRQINNLLMQQKREDITTSQSTRAAAEATRGREDAQRTATAELLAGVGTGETDPTGQMLARLAQVYVDNPDYASRAIEYKTPEEELAEKVAETSATTTAREEASLPFSIRLKQTPGAPSGGDGDGDGTVEAGTARPTEAALLGNAEQYAKSLAEQGRNAQEIMGHLQGSFPELDPRERNRIARVAVSLGTGGGAGAITVGGVTYNTTPSTP